MLRVYLTTLPRDVCLIATFPPHFRGARYAYLRQLRRFVESDDGPTAIEYAMIVALIAVFCMASIRAFGADVIAAFNRAANAVSGYVDTISTDHRPK